MVLVRTFLVIGKILPILNIEFKTSKKLSVGETDFRLQRGDITSFPFSLLVKKGNVAYHSRR